MPSSIARQTNRSGILVVSVLTRGNYINTVQLNYFACRNFIFHITSPYTNKSITDCILIIYDIFPFVNRFCSYLLKKFYFLKFYAFMRRTNAFCYLFGLGLLRFDFLLTAVRRSPSSNSAILSLLALSRVRFALQVSLKFL